MTKSKFLIKTAFGVLHNYFHVNKILSKDGNTPFVTDSGLSYENEAFKVQSNDIRYSDNNKDPNFIFFETGLEVNWEKHFSDIIYVNQDISQEDIIHLVKKCIYGIEPII